MLAFLYGIALLLSVGVEAVARDGPRPPCAGTVSYPQAPEQAGGNPSVRLWYSQDLSDEWTPPTCLGWDGKRFGLLVAVAGKFRDDGGVESVLRRLAAVSSYPGIRYWSVTRGRWRPLVTHAYTLERLDSKKVRADHAANDLQPDKPYYFWQEENTPAGEVVYVLRIRELTPDRLVFTLENALPVRRMFLEVFPPETYQFSFFLDRQAGDLWQFYSLMRSTPTLRLLLRGHEASFINRAVAAYRYFAGIPTDGEAPLAR